MTKAKLLELLADYPDETEVLVVDREAFKMPAEQVVPCALIVPEWKKAIGVPDWEEQEYSEHYWGQAGCFREPTTGVLIR